MDGKETESIGRAMTLLESINEHSISELDSNMYIEIKKIIAFIDEVCL